MMGGAQSGGQSLGLELSWSEPMLVVEERVHRTNREDDVAALRTPI